MQREKASKSSELTDASGYLEQQHARKLHKYAVDHSDPWMGLLSKDDWDQAFAWYTALYSGLLYGDPLDLDRLAEYYLDGLDVKLGEGDREQAIIHFVEFAQLALGERLAQVNELWLNVQSLRNLVLSGRSLGKAERVKDKVEHLYRLLDAIKQELEQ